MTIEQAIAQLENMKLLKGYSNTTVNGDPLADVIDQIIALLKDQDVTIRALMGEFGDSCDVDSHCGGRKDARPREGHQGAGVLLGTQR